MSLQELLFWLIVGSVVAWLAGKMAGDRAGGWIEAIPIASLCAVLGFWGVRHLGVWIASGVWLTGSRVSWSFSVSSEAQGVIPAHYTGLWAALIVSPFLGVVIYFISRHHLRRAPQLRTAYVLFAAFVLTWLLIGAGELEYRSGDQGKIVEIPGSLEALVSFIVSPFLGAVIYLIGRGYLRRIPKLRVASILLTALALTWWLNTTLELRDYRAYTVRHYVNAIKDNLSLATLWIESALEEKDNVGFVIGKLQEAEDYLYNWDVNIPYAQSELPLRYYAVIIGDVEEDLRENGELAPQREQMLKDIAADLRLIQNAYSPAFFADREERLAIIADLKPAIKVKWPWRDTYPSLFERHESGYDNP
jgi:hypothetical protein